MPEPAPARRAIGGFASKLVELTDGVLFGGVWERPELAKRDRSVIMVATLITSSSLEQLGLICVSRSRTASPRRN